MVNLSAHSEEKERMKMTHSQNKTVDTLKEVHGGGTVEILTCGEVRLILPPLLPQYYKKEVDIISRRGKVISQYLITLQGDEKAKYF